eukprot:scaffold3189_cov138-Isochrysis_galbana.AAC.11
MAASGNEVSPEASVREAAARLADAAADVSTEKASAQQPESSSTGSHHRGCCTALGAAAGFESDIGCACGAPDRFPRSIKTSRNRSRDRPSPLGHERHNKAQGAAGVGDEVQVEILGGLSMSPRHETRLAKGKVTQVHQDGGAQVLVLVMGCSSPYGRLCFQGSRRWSSSGEFVLDVCVSRLKDCHLYIATWRRCR